MSEIAKRITKHVMSQPNRPINREIISEAVDKELAEIRAAFEDAIGDAEYYVEYAGDYLKQNHGMPERAKKWRELLRQLEPKER